MNELGLNPPPAAAIRALGNMALSVEGADNRVQDAQDEVIQRLRAALEQSEANNRLVSEQNVRLNERNIQLEQQQVQLEQQFVERKAASKAKYQAVVERFNLHIATIIEKLKLISTHPVQAIDCFQAQFWNAEMLRRPSSGTLHSPDGFVGTPSAYVTHLLQKIDVAYRERVKASNYSPKVICDETTSEVNAIQKQLLDIQVEYQKALQDIDA